jgi:hypothetical protein
MPAVRGVAVEAKTQDRIDEDEQGENLQDEQDVLTQPLKQAVDVQVFDALAPQEGAGNFQRLAFQLEELEQNDGRDDQ